VNLKAILGGLLVWLLLSFATSKLLPLKGHDTWILFAALALVGVIAAAVLVWWAQRKAAAGGDAGTEALEPQDELAQLLAEAEGKLAASRQLKRAARFGNLPVFLILGPASSGKTTTIVQAGIEPELLSGQVYQDNQITPTRLANLWFARQSVLVEPARPVLSDRKRWLSLIRRIQPGRLTATVERGGQAPRAAVVMFDCERLLSGANLATEARELHQQLTEVSRQLGVALPVYALFTKADRIRFFLDYVKPLDDNEARQLLGAGLPLPSPDHAGAYEERQAAAINEALTTIYRSLAEYRLELLRREADSTPLPPGYEFPREFRKLRTAIVQCLVDLCRPSQLSVAPFLRGFYFTGVRPVTVEQAVQRPQAPVRSAEPPSGATNIFRPGQQMQPAHAAPEYVTRRVPQWVFLNGFFPSVVLADESGLSQSGSSVKVSFLRRLLLISAAALALILAIGTTVSYFKNRALETEVQNAAVGLAAPSGDASLPSLDALQRLDRLRIQLATISDYNRDGAPTSYRWGLYIGNSLLPEARAIYFARFRQLLLGGIQTGWQQKLNALPSSPGPGDSYSDAYDRLKSYLITTSNHDKSTVAYLAPELLKDWQNGRSIDADRVSLARKQFEFYAGELFFQNPYSSGNDANAVENARHYLGRFAGIERVYRNMLNEVEAHNPSINFNRSFPGSAAVLVDSYEVPGAYSKQGFAAMTDALKHADKYFAGEQWVLGSQSISIDDRSKLESDMAAKYNAEYIDAWRKYIRAAEVVGYRSIPDAAAKLRQNAGPTSPLLGALCVASENTGVSPAISNAFSTVHKIVPPGCTTGYVGGTNADYMKNLGALQVALDQIGTQKPDPADPMILAASQSANGAKTSVIQLAQSLGLDTDAHLEVKLQQLLEAPIKSTDGLLRGLAPAALNGKGAGLCAGMRSLWTKFPFNPRAQQEATIAEINGIFKPGDGELWKFYDANLAKSLTRTGDPIPGSGVAFNDRFLAFFRRAAAFSNSAYPNGAQDPRIDFTLRAVPSQDVQNLHVTIDGTQGDFPAGSPEAHKFTWPGTSPGVSLSGVSKTSGNFTRPYEGAWATFHFFGDANRAPASGTGVFEWDQTFGATERVLYVIKFDVSMAGSPPVFARGYFNGLSCVSDIASTK
jgi:type VI secretion system protein ImpL